MRPLQSSGQTDTVTSEIMNRRQFLVAGGGVLTMQLPSGAAEGKNAIIELRQYMLRNNTDAMLQRTTDFVGKAYVPALKRAGFGPVGAFAAVIGQESPFLLLVTQFADLAAWESRTRKLGSDEAFVKSSEEYHGGSLQYERMEVTLLRTFNTVPAIEAPKALPENKTRIFELRTYESNTERTLARKIRMFDEGEVGLFRKLGMTPVFFGETIAGRNMPNLTYMLAFDDLAAREKAWGAFVSSPEWAKMRSQPGVSDPEIVSNISNSILRPLPFSAVR